jgi:hypothetical protein
MSAPSFDSSKHRDPHEPEHHWELRKKFLEQNMGRSVQVNRVIFTNLTALLSVTLSPRRFIKLSERLDFMIS